MTHEKLYSIHQILKNLGLAAVLVFAGVACNYKPYENSPGAGNERSTSGPDESNETNEDDLFGGDDDLIGDEEETEEDPNEMVPQNVFFVDKEDGIYKIGESIRFLIQRENVGHISYLILIQEASGTSLLPLANGADVAYIRPSVDGIQPIELPPENARINYTIDPPVGMIKFTLVMSSNVLQIPDDLTVSSIQKLTDDTAGSVGVFNTYDVTINVSR